MASIDIPNKNHQPTLTGWRFQPLLKNISQLGLLFPIYGKIKNRPNHQPDHFWKNRVDPKILDASTPCENRG